jgi:hypothetical protein
LSIVEFHRVAVKEDVVGGMIEEEPLNVFEEVIDKGVLDELDPGRGELIAGVCTLGRGYLSCHA